MWGSEWEWVFVCVCQLEDDDAMLWGAHFLVRTKLWHQQGWEQTTNVWWDEQIKPCLFYLLLFCLQINFKAEQKPDFEQTQNQFAHHSWSLFK